jgi:hypothetical protein
MAFLKEGDCPGLRNAGELAREKGLRRNGRVLSCPYNDCDRVNCRLLEEPLVRTIRIASAQLPRVSPIDRFYRRLGIHAAKKVEASRGNPSTDSGL